MIDYTKRPYASWLEKTIKYLMELDPDSMYIGLIKDDEIVSACWDVGKDERATIIQEMLQLGVMESLENNRDLISDMVVEILEEIKSGEHPDHVEDEEDDEEYNEEEDDE